MSRWLRLAAIAAVVIAGALSATWWSARARLADLQAGSLKPGLPADARIRP